MKFDLMNGHLANRKTVDANPLRDLKKRKSGDGIIHLPDSYFNFFDYFIVEIIAFESNCCFESAFFGQFLNLEDCFTFTVCFCSVGFSLNLQG